MALRVCKRSLSRECTFKDRVLRDPDVKSFWASVPVCKMGIFILCRPVTSSQQPLSFLKRWC